MTQDTPPTTFEEILAECLTALERGEMSLSACLAHYPEHADALKPLLLAAELARRAELPTMSAEAVRRTGEMLRLQARRAPKRALRPRFWAGMSRLAAGLLLVLFVGLAGTGGVVAASAQSMPNEPLYEVKLAWERVIVFFAELLNMADEVWLHLAKVRLEEMAYLQSQGLLTPEQLAALQAAVEAAQRHASSGTQARLEAFMVTLKAHMDAFPPLIKASAPYQALLVRVEGTPTPMPVLSSLTPTPTDTPTSVPSPTPPEPTQTSTPTQTASPTITASATNTPRFPPTPTRTPTDAPLHIPSSTPTWTASPTLTWTPLPMLGLQVTFTPSPTFTQSNVRPLPAATATPSKSSESPFVRETLQAAFMTQTAEAQATQEVSP